MKFNMLALKEDFYNKLSKKNQVLGGYKRLVFSHNDTPIYTLGDKAKKIQKKVINVSLFPSYIKPEFAAENEFEVIKMAQDKITGYAVLINNHKNIDTLLKAEFKKSFRANILRFVNRFEDCFNANYKMFFGDIAKEEYLFLMNSLHAMLTNRFNQRNDQNKILDNWADHFDTTYPLIKSKKASLFVIYHNSTPVHICINHHFNNILFVSIPSYDIDYSKFALGNISLYKILEWSIENGYEVMDMAYGYLEYKRRWSNLIYSFEHHIIYPKNNLLLYIIAVLEAKKLTIKNVLKSMNVDTLMEKSKKIFRKKAAKETSLIYKLENNPILDTSIFKNINQDNSSINFIRSPINDFLFTNKEHIDNLKILEILETKEYLFVGKQTIQKLVIL